MELKSVSLPMIRNIPVYKNREEKKPKIENTHNFEQHTIYESTLHLPLHTGTHVDYPLHVICGGKTSSEYDVFPAYFKALVIDLTCEPLDYIGIEQVRHIDLSNVEALFFKTLRKPLATFDFDFPWINKEAASWISKWNLKFVGIDQPGIERNQPDHMSHIFLLERDILIMEGLDLTHLTNGTYDFFADTLHLESVEAEPLLIYEIR